ncbi:IS21-like element helper ATPase IstB [Clostridium paraputrificum]|uniref:IS21-like element helper ATPase IstB n=1 Tax=Clostridium paraputrificum TaxID=29363 RepID=UPI0011CC9A77|nr:IS21-like element helper ATPase IstB [Clostridium paraputrificum]
MLSKLKDLKLSGITKTLDARNEEAIKENLSFMEFFELLLNDESNNRVANARMKRLTKAKFPGHKTIEEYNFNYQPSLNKREIYNLATCEFIRNKENIAFIGPSGTGKTHLSIAIGVNAISQGYDVLFTTVNQMLDELYMARADNSLIKKMRKYTSPTLLILDELVLKKLSQNNIDDFYEIISKRYEQGSIIVTSNKKFDEWGHIFYDPILATAILDRFIHHCNFILIDGNSYRMKQRQEKLKELSSDSPL